MSKHSRAFLFALMLGVSLAACDGQRSASGPSTRNDGDAANLPAPATQAGSITGMPDPREDTKASATDTTFAVETPPDPLAEGGDINNPDATLAANEPGPDAAVQVIRDYYAAINLRNHAGAYALWRGQGQASGVSATQFAGDFANTSGISVEIGQPGAVDAGAGQRHVEVPVALVVRTTDGSEQRLRGHYVLQRSVADGASDEQRAWRIASAQLSAAQ